MNGENKMYYLGHRGTGKALSLTANQAHLWNQIESLNQILLKQPPDNLKLAARKAISFFAALRRHLFIVKSQSDITDDLNRYHIYRRRRILWEKSANGHVILYYKSPTTERVLKKRLPIAESMIFINASNYKPWITIQKKLLNAGFSKRRIAYAIRRLSHVDLQALRFFPKSAKKDPKLYQQRLYLAFRDFEARDRELKLGKEKQYGNFGHVDLRDFHKFETISAEDHFRDIETTLSFAFRFPSPVFNGTYASALAQKTLKLLKTPKKPINALEVGGGAGYVAKEMLERLHKNDTSNPRLNLYLMVDLSPQFISDQKKMLRAFKRKMEFSNQDAQQLSLNQKFDLAICNEVIADFLTVKIRKGSIRRNDQHALESMAWLKRSKINLSGLPDEFYFNLGAIQLIERVYHHLNPGGLFLLTEFGSRTELPGPTRHLNHDEYSIYWPFLIEAAKTIGFKAVRLHNLSNFLHLNSDVSLFSGDIDVLNRAMFTHPKNRISRNFTQQEVEQLLKHVSRKEKRRIQGLDFSPVRDGRYWGPDYKDFHALVLKK
jgi:SAM-dependent methyltransferase